MHRCLNCGQKSSKAKHDCKQCGWTPPKTGTLFETAFESSDETQHTQNTARDPKYARLDQQSAFRYFTLRAFVPVVVTYLLTIIGIRFFGGYSVVGSTVSVGTALVLTLSHGVMPVFVYRIFGKLSHKNPAAIVLGPHLAAWYGIPIGLLAVSSGWVSLIGPIVHLVRARRGERAWLFMKYGSTSMATVMFLAVSSAESMFPAGLVVVFFQAILLGIVGTIGRGLWVDEVALEQSEQTTEKPPKSTRTQRRYAARVGIMFGLLSFLFLGGISVLFAAYFKHWGPLFFFGLLAVVVALITGVVRYFTALRAVQQFPDSVDPLFDAKIAPLLEFTEYVNGDLKRRPDIFILPFVGKMGGHLESITFRCHDTESKLEYEPPTSDTNGYLRLAFALPNPTSFRASVYATHTVTDLASKLGVIQDKRVGNRSFDDHFIVKCDDSESLKHVICKPVQDALLQLKLWVSDSDLDFTKKRIELSVRENKIVFKLGQYLKESDDLIKFYDESARAYLELDKQLDSLGQSEASTTS